MEENVRLLLLMARAVHVIALGDVSLRKGITMTHTRYAFIKAGWQAEIVDQALVGFLQKVPEEMVDVFEVPGAFEMPLFVQKLAKSGQYGAIIASAFVVDGGIYRHDFVAQAVVNGLMQASLSTGVPVLSVSLTPHQYQDTKHHTAIFRDHFVLKGQEAADAALKMIKINAAVAA